MPDHSPDHSHHHGVGHPHHHHHDHDHDQEEVYYLDQLCTIGLSCAFGAICLSLYFWQTGMLDLMLGPQFHGFVLASGLGLISLAILRAGILWIQVGQEKKSGANGHHHHDHDHSHSGHDHHHHHHHHHDHGGHDHHHHDHHHGHDHDAGDHDQGWAPWRYVVLLVPVILFLLGLPNKPLEAPAMDVNLFRDVSREAFQASRLVCLGPDALEQVGFLGGLLEDQHPLVYVQDPNKAPLKEFGDLENWANSEGKRKEWEGKVVRVIGQFSPSRNNDKVFHLVRQRIQCCGADAVFLRVPIFSSESLTHVKRNDWVQVVGQVGFVPLGKGHVTILSVPGQRAIRPTSPAASFYIR